MVTPILTHIKDALKRLLQQYQSIAKRFSVPVSTTGFNQDASRLDAIIIALTNEIQNIENAVDTVAVGQLFYDGSFFRSSGAQLDGIGEIVGQARNGLDDGIYLLYILAKIAENFSNATIPEMVHIAKLLFRVDTFDAFPMPPAEFNFQIPDTTPTPPEQFPLIANILEASLGAGIGLGFITVFSATNPFAYRDLFGPPVGGGYGDLTNPSVGGEYAHNVFNDPGA